MTQAISNKEATRAGGLNLVTFRLSQQIYALPIECIVQIVPMVTITPLPRTNGLMARTASLLGVINVRGSAVPVVDLRCHLGQGQGRMLLYTPIILSRIDGRMVGMVVDEVLDVVHLAMYELVPLDEIFPEEAGDTGFLSGMARIEDRLVPLLEVNSLFRTFWDDSLNRALENLAADSPAAGVAAVMNTNGQDVAAVG
jgi:purine-binding chemotaxis protein CheW